MNAILGAIGAAVVGLVVALMVRGRGPRTDQHGVVSESWLAEQRGHAEHEH